MIGLGSDKKIFPASGGGTTKRWEAAATSTTKDVEDGDRGDDSEDDWDDDVDDEQAGW